MNIKLSDHFTYKRIARFVISSIGMMIFTSIYGIVDGLFVSNFVGKIPFAAINLIMPFLMILGALGFMVGTGGSAIVAKTLGEGDREKANEYFSLMVYVTFGGGAILAIVGFFLMRPIALLMGSTDAMLEYCVIYGQIGMVSLPFFMLQNVFQSFLITAEKPHMGLAVTVAAGLTNIILDYFFIAVFGWGIVGASIATSASEVMGGLLPVFYFARKNSSLLRLTKCTYQSAVLIKTCVNGSSELMSHISMSLVSVLYNFQLLRFAGEDGVAAYGVMMYANFIYMAVFFGYSLGISPVIAYNFGAQNHDELKNVFLKSIKLMSGSGIVLAALAAALSAPLSMIFVGYDAALFEITRRGLIIYSICFILVGLNVFGSALFTALNNGVISAIISFLRSFIFKTSAVIILPIFWELDGIWISAIAAEVFAFLVTLAFLTTKRHKYHYI